MVIEKAVLDDIPEILELQKLAYISEAEIYHDFSIPPLLQTLEEIKEDFHHQKFLKVIFNNMIIGSVRAYQEGETCFIGRLIVHPDYQNKGLGTRLMKAVEKTFNHVKRYELFTGHKSEKNIYLYKKLGYEKCKMEALNEKVKLIFLEKTK